MKLICLTLGFVFGLLLIQIPVSFAGCQEQVSGPIGNKSPYYSHHLVSALLLAALLLKVKFARYHHQGSYLAGLG